MWYRQWFSSPFYPMLYRHRDRAEAKNFIDALAEFLRKKNICPGAHLLDMACGRGRHAFHLAKKGYRVTGIDLSEENIRFARKFPAKGLSFRRQDMRMPSGRALYDAVLNLFTSFGYFGSDRENYRVIRAASLALKREGMLIMDFLNTPRVREALKAGEKKRIEGVEFIVKRRFTGGIFVKEIDVRRDGKQRHFEERVRGYRREDFTRFFRRAGFDLSTLEMFGNYRLEPFDEKRSERMIMAIRK